MERNELIAILFGNPNESRPILVCGLGITGIETSLWLRRENLPVIAVEKLSEEQYRARDKFGRLDELRSAGVGLFFGIDGEGVRTALPAIEDAARQESVRAPARLAILSPGISLSSPIVGALRRLQIPFVTELELGVFLSQVPAICITGSNGKTTTVSLLAAVLESLGGRVLLCGNVGQPIVAAFRPGEGARGLRERIDWLVVEASSYQLEGCEHLVPKVGVLLNLSDNHLERHGSMERYRDAKLSMVTRQSRSEHVVINRDDRWFGPIIARLPGSPITFGRKNAGLDSDSLGRGCVAIDGTRIVWGAEPQQTLDTARAKLRGAHNRENIAAVVGVLLAIGEDPARAVQAILEFYPIEHRLEVVCEKNGVTVINDSKSTTVAASVAALRAVDEVLLSDTSAPQSSSSGIVLCLGGCAKAGSWKPLIEELGQRQKRMRGVVCFGQDGPLIADTLGNHGGNQGGPLIEVSPTMERGVEAAFRLCRSGDTLLFSPGCASFDQFLDFEHRGRAFKSLFGA